MPSSPNNLYNSRGVLTSRGWILISFEDRIAAMGENFLILLQGIHTDIITVKNAAAAAATAIQEISSFTPSWLPARKLEIPFPIK